MNLQLEVKRMRQWVDDLQSGMYVNCVYCGHRYGPKETTPVTMADALKQHIATCEKHPMAKLFKACTEADLLISSLLAGRGGPAARELLHEIQKLIRAAIAEARP